MIDTIQLDEKSENPILISPESLLGRIESNDEDILIVDLGQAQLYDRLHIPGAVHLPFGALTSGIKPATGKLPPLEQLKRALASIGYHSDKMVIAYDDEGGGWAGRFIWTLDLLGHKNSRYLDGGIHNWLNKKLPVEKEVLQAQASDCSDGLSVVNAGVNVGKEHILERLGRSEMVIWDARSPEEYSGERIFAQKGGHIPGAVNYEWTRAMDLQNGLQLRGLGEIRSELEALGITADKEVITHCQTHHRSGFTYLIGKILGFSSIKAYSGSWSEWGNDVTLPIEQGSASESSMV